MGIGTGISYACNTLNPAGGCRAVSKGCAHCFAARVVATRLGKNPLQPAYHGLAEERDGRVEWTGKATWNSEKLAPLLRRARPEIWFVGDMADLLFEEQPEEHFLDVLAHAVAAPQHVVMTTTKRSARMRDVVARADLGWVARRVGELATERLPERRRRAGWRVAYEITEGHETERPAETVAREADKVLVRKASWPPPNWWCGASVEDEPEAALRLPGLWATKARVRWVSYEPALGPVDWAKYIGTGISWLDLLVCGGESGERARAMRPEWARGARDAAEAAGVPFHFKQWGEFDANSDRVGKKAAGYRLDGRVHHAFPRALPASIELPHAERLLAA
jgi:protein gp37